MLGIFLDIETNGLDPFQHAPLEIAIQIIDLETGVLQESYQSLISCSHDQWNNRDPESLCVTRFSSLDIESAPTIDQVGADIVELFQKVGIRRGYSVFICQNPSFDRPFFAKLVPVYVQEEKKWPYHWLDLASMYWALYLSKEQKMNSRGPMSVSKDSIGERFGLGKEPHPHRAMNGVEHLIACYEAVVGYS